jgi:hypothetical protein
MRTLENKTIKILEAKTEVNTVSNKSRLQNTEITFGTVIFKREDGLFFENIIIENNEWRPFLRFENNNIELQNITNRKAKTITITKYN